MVGGWHVHWILDFKLFADVDVGGGCGLSDEPDISLRRWHREGGGELG